MIEVGPGCSHCYLLLVNYTLTVPLGYLTAQGTLGHIHLLDLARVMKVYKGAPYVYLVPLQGVEQVIALDPCPPQFPQC